MNGDLSPSATAIFQLHYLDPPTFTIGKYGDGVVLFGEVKIEEGAGITITRDSEKNALRIGVSTGD